MPKKIAIAKITIAIPRNQCFAFLVIALCDTSNTISRIMLKRDVPNVTIMRFMKVPNSSWLGIIRTK